jgi:hypothetical protein
MHWRAIENGSIQTAVNNGNKTYYKLTTRPVKTVLKNVIDANNIHAAVFSVLVRA